MFQRYPWAWPLMLVLVALQTADGLPAFPGAEGYGS